MVLAMGPQQWHRGAGQVVVFEHYAFRWLNHELVEVIDLESGDRRDLSPQRRAAAEEPALAPPLSLTAVRRRYGNGPAAAFGQPRRPARA
jgi:hypothetical protein